ncbi:MAG: phosphoribosylglycinamide formyltransferase [Geminicoccaceae bacterium]
MTGRLVFRSTACRPDHAVVEGDRGTREEGAPAKKTAVLISGRGSNMKALIEAGQRPDVHFEISLVLSNRPAAGGLAAAEASGIPTAVVDHKVFASRDEFDRALHGVLCEAGIELVCLAGFMRIFTADFVEHWHDRLLNIHPSLLPAFKGLHTHEQALAAGVRVHGCTVHLVRAELDDGPIIVQGVVPVEQDDTADNLAARVLTLEHRCYPQALELIASGRARIEGERVIVEGTTPLVTWLDLKFQN